LETNLKEYGLTIDPSDLTYSQIAALNEELALSDEYDVKSIVGTKAMVSSDVRLSADEVAERTRQINECRSYLAEAYEHVLNGDLSFYVDGNPHYFWMPEGIGINDILYVDYTRKLTWNTHKQTLADKVYSITSN